MPCAPDYVPRVVWQVSNGGTTIPYYGRASTGSADCGPSAELAALDIATCGDIWEFTQWDMFDGMVSMRAPMPGKTLTNRDNRHWMIGNLREWGGGPRGYGTTTPFSQNWASVSSPELRDVFQALNRKRFAGGDSTNARYMWGSPWQQFVDDMTAGRWVFFDVEYKRIYEYNNASAAGICVKSGTLRHYFLAGDLRMEGGVQVVTVIDSMCDGRCTATCANTPRPNCSGGGRAAGDTGGRGTGLQTYTLAGLKTCVQYYWSNNMAGGYSFRMSALIDGDAPPPGTITNATAANPTMITVANHGYQLNDYILITGSATAGLNDDWPVDAKTTNTMTIPYNNIGRTTDPGGMVRPGTEPPPPAGTITALSTTNPAVITAAGHGLSAGQYVRVTGSSLTALNRTWLISAATSTTLTIPYNNIGGSTNPGGTVALGTPPPPPAGTITAATATNPTTLTVQSHTLVTGDWVLIAGASITGLNGTWRVDASTSTSITVAYGNLGGSTNPGGTAVETAQPPPPDDVDANPIDPCADIGQGDI